jgi:hypothetical protein
MIYRNNNQNLRDIWVTRSTNAAASFEVATDVDATDWQLNSCPISGPRMARAGDSLATIWMSQASGAARIYVSTLHAATMSAGQQWQLPNNTSGAPLSQSFPDIAASGDTIGVVFMEKAREIVFLHSTSGVNGLSSTPKRFLVPNHTLQYPAIRFRNNFFHLLYADPTADKILYRQGTLTQSTAAEEVGTPSLNVLVSPNPVGAGGQLQIQCEHPPSGNIQMDLFDRTGRSLQRIHTSFTTSTLHWQIPALPSGLYMLVMRSNDGIIHREKIVVE